MDEESWFSVTPERIAEHIARRIKGLNVLDAFCGAGGNLIQFAKFCPKVYGIDIDKNKIKMAQHNASIYKCNSISFICKDFLKLKPEDLGANIDVVFLAPPWGGVGY